MDLTKNDIIGLIQYVSGELKEDLIDVTEEDAESILKDYLESINYTQSCSDLIKNYIDFFKYKGKTYIHKDVIEVLIKNEDYIEIG